MEDLYLCDNGNIVNERGKCRGAIIEVLPGDLRVKLSKKLAGILRHYPERYGIKLTRDGWANINDIVRSLGRDPRFRWIKKWHIHAIALFDTKGRYEVKDNMIRARYGHSIPVDVEIEYPDRVPRYLYHGTTANRVAQILAEGIKPMKRLRVHLSESIEDAIETGRRHKGKVVVLVIDSECLKEKGFGVGKAGRTVYIVDYVPPPCITTIITHH